MQASDTNQANSNEFDFDPTNTLYHKLTALTKTKLEYQFEYLKKSVDSLLENEESVHSKVAFYDIVNYTEFLICDESIGLRQDSVIDISNGKQVLSFPNNPIFSSEMLREIDNNITNNGSGKNKGASKSKSGFNIYHHFDANGYLSSLIIIAHYLNNTFHSSIEEIFLVDKTSLRNDNFNLSYRPGPVKAIQRCQAKAETVSFVFLCV